jgi:hypothetical protein
MYCTPHTETRMEKPLEQKLVPWLIDIHTQHRVSERIDGGRQSSRDSNPCWLIKRNVPHTKIVSRSRQGTVNSVLDNERCRMFTSEDLLCWAIVWIYASNNCLVLEFFSPSAKCRACKGDSAGSCPEQQMNPKLLCYSKISKMRIRCSPRLGEIPDLSDVSPAHCSDH